MVHDGGTQRTSSVCNGRWTTTQAPVLCHHPVGGLPWTWPCSPCVDRPSIMFHICCDVMHHTLPNASRLTNHPTTMSCRRPDLEKPIVLRTSRFSRVRKVRWVRAILCVDGLPTVWCAGSR